MTRRSYLIAAAWIGLFLIMAATLSPIGIRPSLPISVDAERVTAFMVVGFLFALAYPKHIWFAAIVVLIGAFGLEILQELRPDRHARFRDAMWKSIGASVGLGLGWTLIAVLPFMSKRQQ
nr:VanZ family protein [uncultured Devosia sp.]